MASKKNGTLYIGVTSNLIKRVFEHKNSVFSGFTAKYNIHDLVYFEEFHDMYSAISREKQLKGWVRIKKIKLIESINPDWSDLSHEWFMDSSPAAQNDEKK